MTHKIPEINVTALNLAKVSNQAWKALRAANNPPFIFRYGNGLVQIDLDADGRPLIKPVDEDRMRFILARVAYWYKVTRDGPKDTLPPLAVVRDLLTNPNPLLPILERIVEAPVFSPDGVLHVAPGYNAASRCYYRPAKGLYVRPVSPRPSKANVASALALIRDELLRDFPFVTDAERAHAIGLLLLPFVRQLIDGPTPLHLVEKPTPGTGGSLLADVLTYPFLGHNVPVLAEAESDQEWRKRITAQLMSGDSLILIDNIKKTVDSASLSSALTGPQWRDRILGENRMATLPVNAIWIATGNNPILSNEIARRTVRIRLDAGRAQPWLRNGFRHPNLRAWVVRNRGKLIWAALTIVQGWIGAGKPEGTVVMGSFEQWSKVIGGILETAGVKGFLGNLQELYQGSDAEAEAWSALIHRWDSLYGDHPVGVGFLYEIISPEFDDPIEIDLGPGSVQSRKTRLGILIRQNRNRRFGDLILTEAGRKRGAQQWKLLKAEAATSVTLSEPAVAKAS
jgi:putative DNA primase/helicase